MSDFANLRKARHAKEQLKSYVSRTANEHDKVVHAGPQLAKGDGLPSKLAAVPDGLYTGWPASRFEIRISDEDPLHGRGIFSREQYRPGDILAVVKPSVSVLSIANLSNYCSACASPALETKALRRCPNCKVVHYCDAVCQTRDWSLHKHECTALQSWAKAAPSAQVAIPSDAVRCLGRTLWRKRKSDSQGVIIDGMQSHRTSLQPSVYELHTHLAHALVRYLDLSSPEKMAGYGLMSVADLVDLISRFATNAIGLATPSLTAIGTCVSPSIALLNHSCDPNVVIVFPRTSSDPKVQEPLVHVVAIKPIIAGEELLTSYIDVTLSLEERQKSLKQTYNFDCRCSLCVPATKFVDPREALLCPTRKNASTICNGLCEIPTEATTTSRCNVCNASIDVDTIPEILDAIAVAGEGLEKAIDYQFKDPERAMRLTSNLIGILTSGGLAPGAHPLLALSRLHSALLIDNLPDLGPVVDSVLPPQQDPLLDPSGMASQAAITVFQQSRAQHLLSPQTAEEKEFAEGAQQKLDDAIRAALRTSTGLSSLLAPGHPLRGLALAELGKLLSVDERVPKYLAGSDSNGESQKGIYPPSGPARLRLARETLIRARSESMIGFGGANEGGEVGKEVRQWLIRVEKELQVWTTGMQGLSRP